MVWRQGNALCSGYRDSPLKQHTKQESKINGLLVTAASGDQRQAFVPLIISQNCRLPLHSVGSMFHTHPFYHPLWMGSSSFFPHDRGSLCLLKVMFHSLQVLPSLLTHMKTSFNTSLPLMCSALFFLHIICFLSTSRIAFPYSHPLPFITMIPAFLHNTGFICLHRVLRFTATIYP